MKRFLLIVAIAVTVLVPAAVYFSPEAVAPAVPVTATVSEAVMPEALQARAGVQRVLVQQPTLAARPDGHAKPAPLPSPRAQQSVLKQKAAPARSQAPARPAPLPSYRRPNYPTASAPGGAHYRPTYYPPGGAYYGPTYQPRVYYQPSYQPYYQPAPVWRPRLFSRFR